MSLVATAPKPRSVLIASDFSQVSEKALCHALAIARFYGSRFCLAHVVSSLGLTIAGPGAIAACEESVSRDAAQLEESLIRSGALLGVRHKFIVRRGEIWPELREIIRQEKVDLIVVGTHGREGFRKFFFGSVAEQILRQADCPVLAFGPCAYERPWIGTSSPHRTFLFATDFEQASLQGLQHAIAAANQFWAKLAFLSIIPGVPLPQSRCWHTPEDLNKVREDARTKALHRLTRLATHAILEVRPEFHVEFASPNSISDSVLETAERLRADLIMMGVHYSAHAGLVSHLALSTAYEVVCHASCPVMTINSPSGNIEVATTTSTLENLPLSEADLVRIHGFGAKW